LRTIIRVFYVTWSGNLHENLERASEKWSLRKRGGNVYLSKDCYLIKNWRKFRSISTHSFLLTSFLIRFYPKKIYNVHESPLLSFVSNDIHTLLLFFLNKSHEINLKPFVSIIYIDFTKKIFLIIFSFRSFYFPRDIDPIFNSNLKKKFKSLIRSQ